MTSGAPAQKRHAAHWHGYGFLPGYHQPPNNAVPIYGRKGAVTGEPDYSPQYYGYDGEWHYFGRPGFYRGRYNGGSFGPCWNWTPIGAGVELRVDVVIPGRALARARNPWRRASGGASRGPVGASRNDDGGGRRMAAWWPATLSFITR